ncbi:uncharacterized protein BDZ99DRAFT_492508 [Mytilinidion resinicola]|uniref:Zn(2)-C6 fungal-type domain-containing protein n=1 Tax=Mytilinidion resinicola TaxID=574789 RepID=A0A6A6Y125_9PEZI|nr:uncharacterized protein BDZ99DRAFT_492508 [Mytilinidion resinicola]KAF2801517.1 hypothetical protein BDZ99DRAFT_492508 [Mytilinidion resinicola]
MASTDAATRTHASISTNHGADARPAKRNRITIACTWCRQRKSRCDGARPKCSTCTDHGYECTYLNLTPLTKTSASKEYLEALESRLAALESSVGGISSRVTRIEGSRADIVDANASSSQSPPTHTPDLLSLQDDEGTIVETQDPTDGMGSVSFTKEEESGFFGWNTFTELHEYWQLTGPGPSSNISFTRLIVRTTTAVLKSAASDGSPASPSNAALQSQLLHVSRPLSPVSDPSKDSYSIAIGTEPSVLPQENETVKMIERFFSTTGVLFPYIDEEAFLNTYHELTSANIRTVRRSWLGLLNLVLAMSTSASHGNGLTASERSANSDVFFRRALALCEKQIRHGTSLEVVQFLLLMSQYLQGTERSIETWNVHGLTVKAAYQLGLHSRDALNQYPPLEREIRKRTWFGCVVLDRTLSMTMGRPASIPENFVKLDLPCSFKSILPAGMNSHQNSTDEHSVEFYTGTITLYKIMGEIVDVLYGSNLGCGVPDNVFDIASQLLQFEQKFLIWQHSLPAALSLVEPETLDSNADEHGTLRFRVILTLRFLNLRILTHRPLLSKYLESIRSAQSASQQLPLLKQVGTNSLRTCAYSAVTIIKLMQMVLIPTSPARHLLGAWWFSLYYAFNAALVIFSTLLVQHQANIYNHPLALEDINLSVGSLHQAIECLKLLFKGNRMTEKCVRYTTSLAHLLSLIYEPEGAQALRSGNFSTDPPGDFSLRRAPNDFQSHDLFDFLDATDSHMGMSLDDLLGTSDFNFMSSH